MDSATMTTDPHPSPLIVRTERGLTIAGTRITLYDVMDYLQDERPEERIRNDLRLSDEQLVAALNFIDAHRAEVEAEYELVMKEAGENRRYWEECNRHRLAEIAAAPPTTAREALRARLADHRARRASQNTQPTSA